MRGWVGLYRLSWRLGGRYLREQGYLREAVIRIVIPLDPSRYLELPDVLRELSARSGERVLDLASPKLAAVALADAGADVTSVDALETEVDTWRRLTGDRPNPRFVVGDGRRLPFDDASFDHVYSISVLEHIDAPGDEVALRELVRVVRPGGRVVVTLPYAEEYSEHWRDKPLYGDRPPDRQRYFFERWYDEARIRRLVEAAPNGRLLSSRVSRLVPNWHALYQRAFPWLVPLGPLFGLLAWERIGRRGDVIRLTLVKETA